MNLSELTTFFSEEEANAIRSLVEARAKALSLTIESFLEQFPLELQKNETGPDETFSMNEWKQQRDRWHKDSHHLTKNDDGSPKVFYHGTNANFEAFNENFLGHSTNASSAKEGFFFSDEAYIASIYARISIEGALMMPCHLNC